jgi:intracellular septation protein
MQFNDFCHSAIVSTCRTGRPSERRWFRVEQPLSYYSHPAISTGSASRMQLFIDYIPIVAFFSAYFYKDIYFATAVLMGAMPAILLVQWLVFHKLSKIFVSSTILVLVLGAATLFFRSPDFLYWKPTVLNWGIAAVFLGSQWIGSKTIAERMLGSAAELSAAQWKRLNQIWIVFFVVVGALNIFVAYQFSEAFWVKFKLFGMLGLTVIFVVIQSIWLALVSKKNAETDSDQGA